MVGKKWKQTEIDCVNFLKSSYAPIVKEIIHMGDSDSTVADIKIIKTNGEIFWIEIKSELSQCGQFVVKLQDKQFIFSKYNKSINSSYSMNIIDAMNANYTYFAQVSTKGLRLNLNEQYYIDWIKWYYGCKGVKLFIVKRKEQFILFPIQHFESYFNVDAVYRIKKSGSRNVSISNQQKVIDYMLKQKLINKKTSIQYGKKLILEKHFDSKVIFCVDNNKYQLSELDKKRTIVRQLSKTFNANVIFTIQLKKNVSGLTDEEIKSYLV